MMLCLLVLVACSSPAPQDVPANRQSTIEETALPPSAAAPPPDTSKPGEIRIFRDWAVGCDNGLDCKATVLGSETPEFPQLTFSVEREAGPLGGLRIGILGLEDVVPPISVTIDGKAIASGGMTTPEGTFIAGPDAQRIAAAMVNGRQAVLRSGTASQTLSLAGASAALRYIDDRQGRAGTQGALVARGPAAATIPRAPAIPELRVPALGGSAATIAPDLLAAMRDIASCQDFGDDYGEPDVHALRDGLSVVALPCSRGAYNVMSAILLVENGEARLASLDSDTTMHVDQGGVPALTNASYASGIFSSAAKGRGLGDCGVEQSFAWDGSGFRLVEQLEMPECRGSTDRIRTFRAQVVREGGD